MKKQFLLTAVLLFVCTAIFAQGDFRLSEQMFSRINQNPSAVGNNDKIQIFTATRLQYVGMGLEQSPTSALLNAHYYNESLKSGFGLSVTYDELGLQNQTINAKVCYAYNLDIFENGLLSLGLSAGVINKTFDPQRHIWENPADPNIPESAYTQTDFDLDFGFEFSYKYIMAGFSITHLPNVTKELTTVAAPSQLNAYVRGNVYLPEKFNLIPAIAYSNVGALNKVPETAKLDKWTQENLLDFSVTAMYDGKYYLGVGYRLNNMVSIMAGFEWQWLRLGYCYDISVGKLANLTSSTHELMLSFIIPTTKPVIW